MKRLHCLYCNLNRVQETAEEEETRLKKWEAFLNSGKGSADSKEQNDLSGVTTQNDPHVPVCGDENQQDIDSDGTRSSAGSGDETEEEK